MFVRITPAHPMSNSINNNRGINIFDLNESLILFIKKIVEKSTNKNAAK